MMRRIISDLLYPLRISQILAADSTEVAMNVVEGHSISLAILDIQGPGMTAIRNGIDILHWTHDQLPEMPVIMITNSDQVQYRTTCSSLGASHLFDKSFDLQNLSIAVGELLK